MNLNTSEESHTMSTEQRSTHLNLMRESPPQPDVSPLERTTLLPTELPIMSTGENELNQTLMPSVTVSRRRNATNSAKPLVSLRSNVKSHEILEKLPVEPRILRVRKEDVAALCQVISEFQEQFLS
jgi:replicative superfamily II helicase